MKQVGVLLVDDHAILRQGLRLILEEQGDISVLGEASDADEACLLAQELHPDLVVMDIGLAHSNGVEATRRIKEVLPDVRVVALTMHCEDEYLMAMLEAGADGYLVKDSIATQLVQAVRAAIKGEMAFSPLATKRLIANVTGRSPVFTSEPLSDREKEILRLIAEGETSKDIAGRLHLSARTVDNHRAAIIGKLQARNIVEAVVLAFRQGLIPAERMAGTSVRS